MNEGVRIISRENEPEWICGVCNRRFVAHDLRNTATMPDHECLRDRFAMAALTGVVAFETGFGAHPSRLDLESMCVDSYCIADRMLEVRKRSDPRAPRDAALTTALADAAQERAEQVKR